MCNGYIVHLVGIVCIVKGNWQPRLLEGSWFWWLQESINVDIIGCMSDMNEGWSPVASMNDEIPLEEGARARQEEIIGAWRSVIDTAGHVLGVAGSQMKRLKQALGSDVRATAEVYSVFQGLQGLRLTAYFAAHNPHVVHVGSTLDAGITRAVEPVLSLLARGYNKAVSSPYGRITLAGTVAVPTAAIVISQTGCGVEQGVEKPAGSGGRVVSGEAQVGAVKPTEVPPTATPEPTATPAPTVTPTTAFENTPGATATPAEESQTVSFPTDLKVADVQPLLNQGGPYPDGFLEDAGVQELAREKRALWWRAGFNSGEERFVAFGTGDDFRWDLIRVDGDGYVTGWLHFWDKQAEEWVMAETANYDPRRTPDQDISFHLPELSPEGVGYRLVFYRDDIEGQQGWLLTEVDADGNPIRVSNPTQGMVYLEGYEPQEQTLADSDGRQYTYTRSASSNEGEIGYLTAVDGANEDTYSVLDGVVLIERDGRTYPYLIDGDTLREIEMTDFMLPDERLDIVGSQNSLLEWNDEAERVEIVVTRPDGSEARYYQVTEQDQERDSVLREGRWVQDGVEYYSSSRGKPWREMDGNYKVEFVGEISRAEGLPTTVQEITVSEETVEGGEGQNRIQATNIRVGGLSFVGADIYRVTGSVRYSFATTRFAYRTPDGQDSTVTVDLAGRIGINRPNDSYLDADTFVGVVLGESEAPWYELSLWGKKIGPGTGGENPNFMSLPGPQHADYLQRTVNGSDLMEQLLEGGNVIIESGWYPHRVEYDE